MILLPGEGIDDADISVSCPNCAEKVLVPPLTVRNLVQKLSERKIQPESDNIPFKYHQIAISDKKNIQARELVYLRHALDETEDLEEYVELSRRYIKKQRIYLVTLREAASAYRSIGELIEETTSEHLEIVHQALKRNGWLDGYFEDIRATCDTLVTDNRNFERYREAAIRTSPFYRTQYASCRK